MPHSLYEVTDVCSAVILVIKDKFDDIFSLVVAVITVKLLTVYKALLSMEQPE